MYITKYGCVFLKLGESIYIRGNRSHSHTLLGSLPLAHNAQHSLVITITIAALFIHGALACGVKRLHYMYNTYVRIIYNVSSACQSSEDFGDNQVGNAWLCVTQSES